MLQEEEFVNNNLSWDKYLNHISIDCVVFGFHEGALKVLLVKMKGIDELYLPGAFVLKEESLEDAASRILKERTGAENIFLKQFYTFGDPHRSEYHIQKYKEAFEHDEEFFTNRFISIGFYALVDYTDVNTSPDVYSEDCNWYEIPDLPTLILDHNLILNKALEALRIQLNYQPIGLNLLPREFTMSELQKMYEVILNKKLDRRNFQRRMLSFDILTRHDTPRKSGAHKAPYLYSFCLEKYNNALKEGLRGGW
ncbi:NUDIX hydrolase [Rubrolithibacter danxiaensis]|uniref:NUDIX hydrolase n=1 Tax=Rubrolithibacter danxiaensis TaxID=3390805 RepID=UPI003BF7F10B